MGIIASMTLESVLNEYMEQCEALYRLLMEENSLLKSAEGALPDADFYSRKETLVAQQEEGLKRFQDARKAKPHSSPREKALAKKIQDKCMKINLIEKENESLYLKHFRPMGPNTVRGYSEDKVRALYSGAD